MKADVGAEFGATRGMAVAPLLQPHSALAAPGNS